MAGYNLSLAGENPAISKFPLQEIVGALDKKGEGKGT